MNGNKHSVALNKEDKTTRYIIRGKDYVSRPSAIGMIPKKICEGRYTCEKLEGTKPGTSKTASTKKCTYHKNG